MIKAVFCDVDNTLTSSKTRTIPASALEAIQKARKNGVKVFAATGRHTRTYDCMVSRWMVMWRLTGSFVIFRMTLLFIK